MRNVTSGFGVIFSNNVRLFSLNGPDSNPYAVIYIGTCARVHRPAFLLWSPMNLQKLLTDVNSV